MIFIRFRYDGRKPRWGLWAVVLVFLLQAIAWAGMPRVANGEDDAVIIVCTRHGMTTLPLAAFEAQGNSDRDATLPESGGFCVLCPLMLGLATLPAPVILARFSHARPAPLAPLAKVAIVDRVAPFPRARAPPLSA